MANGYNSEMNTKTFSEKNYMKTNNVPTLKLFQQPQNVGGEGKKRFSQKVTWRLSPHTNCALRFLTQICKQPKPFTFRVLLPLLLLFRVCSTFEQNIFLLVNVQQFFWLAQNDVEVG